MKSWNSLLGMSTLFFIFSSVDIKLTDWKLSVKCGESSLLPQEIDSQLFSFGINTYQGLSMWGQVQEGKFLCQPMRVMFQKVSHKRWLTKPRTNVQIMVSTVIQVWRKCGWRSGTPSQEDLERAEEEVVLVKDHLKFREDVESMNKLYDHRTNLRSRSQLHWPRCHPWHPPSLFYRKNSHLFFSSSNYGHPWCPLKIVIVVLK